MAYVSPFREGVKAAVPIWVAFIPFSFALGVAAETHGLSLGEIVFMSAVVFAGPAQFAVLEPLASARPAMQILLTTFLINLRFLPMSTAIAPYFRRVRRVTILFYSHFLSASTFIPAYVRFQKESRLSSGDEKVETTGHDNLRYFLGVATTSFSVWVLGSGLGYWVALEVPAGLEEGLKFILPGYFACMLATEFKGRAVLLIGLASFFAGVPGAMFDPTWGWLATAFLLASVGWGIDQWTRRA